MPALEHLESLSSEKGLLTPAAADVLIEAYERELGPLKRRTRGRHAWVDPNYKRRLGEEGSAALVALVVGQLQVAAAARLASSAAPSIVSTRCLHDDTTTGQTTAKSR